MPQDPKHAGPSPPEPEQQQEPPGHTAEMTPEPDHGEESYKGSGSFRVAPRLDDPGGKGGELQPGNAARAGRPAEGAGADLCAAGLRRGKAVLGRWCR